MSAINSILSSLVTGVRNINRKYAKPQIEMTRLVKVCLMSLRVYLFVLIGLMIYKFIVSIR